MEILDAFPLWPEKPPGALGDDPVKDVPTLTPYLPAPGTANGTAVIVCPGGGYRVLAGYEGKDYALWLNERGITAFVLKYRLGSNGYRFSQITADIFRAVRAVRFRAGEFGLDPNRIGVMGSSAGGHLSSVALTWFDSGQPDAEDPVERMSSRPDFGILCYAVISMLAQPELGSRTSLLGEAFTQDWAERLSSELRVTEDTPPCFIWHTQEDVVVRAQHALMFAGALQEKGISFSLHIYPKGAHGVALGIKGYKPGVDTEKLHPWTAELHRWFQFRGLIPA